MTTTSDRRRVIIGYGTASQADADDLRVTSPRKSKSTTRRITGSSGFSSKIWRTAPRQRSCHGGRS